MWQPDVATRPHHGAGENEGLLDEYETVVGDDGSSDEERWYHDEEDNVQDVFEAGAANESSTGAAERKTYPGYPRFETRGCDRLDWRDVTTAIVSPCSMILYNSVRPFPSFCLLHAGSLSAHIAHCVPFNSHSVIHSFAA
jgi:hypothetical protein